MKRARDIDKEDSASVRKEEILGRTSNEYEAIVAIAKEARRLNAVPGVFLDKDESAIPKAFDNFVGGRVDYVVEGDEGDGGAPGVGRGAVKKPARKAAKKKGGKGGGR